MSKDQADEPQMVFMADQAVRSLGEDVIGTINEAVSMLGAIHRIVIMDEVTVNAHQLQYLHKAYTEFGTLLNFLTDLSVNQSPE